MYKKVNYIKFHFLPYKLWLKNRKINAVRKGRIKQYKSAGKLNDML